MASNPFDVFGGSQPAAPPAPIQNPGAAPNPYSYGATPGMGQQHQEPIGQSYPSQQLMFGSPQVQQPQMLQQQFPGMQEYGMHHQQQQQQPPAPAAAPVAQDPWGAPSLSQQPLQQTQQQLYQQSYQQPAAAVPAPVAQDPWSAPPPSQPPQQSLQQNQQPPQQPYQQSYPYGEQQPMQTPYQQPPAPAAAAATVATNGGYDPWSASPAAPANQQLVVSQQQQQYNSYAGMVASVQPNDFAAAQQSLVPSTQQQPSPWGVPQQQQQQQAPMYGALPTGGGGYDPFAAPAPPPAPVYAPTPVQVPAPVVQEQQENPFGDFLPPSAPPAAPAASQDARPTEEVQIVLAQERTLQEYKSGGGSLQHHQQQRPDSDSRAIVPRAAAAAASPVRNPYAGELARQAPSGASPLPKAELVKKTGFILSRISFRTIVMKKWKQAFWVQYGSHTMLWFRSQGDFDDWLNNPYHTQAQRNFMIKLAVNFVHDLYKPNVRGYQVTQCRVKPYGNKMVRQFKLERWMDYGPTIAAAFGSYDPKEVDGLREAIVECMRNTPLNNGIRATGAIRVQDSSQDERPAPQRPQIENGYRHDDNNNNNGDGQRYNSTASAHTMPNPVAPARATRSVVSTTDLLDDHRDFDDSASVPATPSRPLVPAQYPSQPYPGAPNVVFASQGYHPQQQPPTSLGYQPTAAAAAASPYQQQPPPPQQQQYQQQQQQYQQQQPPQQSAYGQIPPQNQQHYPQQAQYHQAPPPPQQQQQQYGGYTQQSYQN